ncbi:MAG: LysR family transcriptional regulator [Myxococcales bacterium]|nr:LysR family transcriptional regulator [Myxococcales bacterium]
MSLDLDALRAFVKVAELLSFTRAAEQLGAPKARVSEQVRRLERDVGSVLFTRTTRAVRLTSDGEAFLVRARRLALEADELETMFATSRALRGRVRIDLPVNIACDLVIPRLAELHAEYPGLALQVSTTDRIVDVVREGFDAVVRVGALRDSELTATRIGELTMVNCASPEYVRTHGRPRTPADLDGHVLVHYSAAFGVEAPELEWVEAGRVRSRRLHCIVTVNSADAFRAACIAGLGIAQLPWLGAERHVREGRLVELLPRFRAPPLPVTLLHPHGRSAPRRVRVVLDWLTAVLSPHVTV